MLSSYQSVWLVCGTFVLLGSRARQYCPRGAYFKMAGRPKRELRKPKRLIEFLRDNRPNNEKKTYKTKRDQSLYDIEVTEVDRERKRLKIHYVGYSEAHDEWRP